MRKYTPLIGYLRRNPRHSRFPIPNTVWAYNLKPIEFVILPYLCCCRSHKSSRIEIIARTIASAVHLTEVCDDSLPLDLRDEGVERFRAQAESSEPYAQLLLGKLYRDGPLVTPDWVEARYWFEQAAQSLPDAQYALGKLLLTNDVEVHDREQGIR